MTSAYPNAGLASALEIGAKVNKGETKDGPGDDRLCDAIGGQSRLNEPAGRLGVGGGSSPIASTRR